jgi:peptidoglycan/LPS O-acetylase OafA/YrhL
VMLPFRTRPRPHPAPASPAGVGDRGATADATGPTIPAASPGEGPRGGTGPVRYDLLDVMRGLAALWVLAFHTAGLFKGSSPVLFGVAERGYLGVPMFFVISGYCIMASARGAVRRGEPTLGFLRRRLTRIYPPFWCSIVVATAVPFVLERISALRTGVYTPPAVAFRAYGPLDWLGIVTLTRVFEARGRDLQAAFNGVNSVYWTLAIEVQFYLVMAVALARRSRPWLPSVLVGVTLTSLPFAATPAAYRTGWFLPYWPMFALGLLLHRLLERGISPGALWGRRAPPVSCGLAAIIATTYWHYHRALPADVGLQVFALAFCAVLWSIHALDGPVAGLASSGATAPRVAVRALFLIGLMSYSIYLVHVQVCFVMMQCSRQVFRVGSLAHALATVAGTVLLCYPFYLLCERPTLRLASGRGPARAPAPPHARPPA